MDIYKGDSMEEEIVYPEFLILENEEIARIIMKHLKEEQQNR